MTAQIISLTDRLTRSGVSPPQWYLPDDQRPALAVGVRIHCILYGGKDGTIMAVHGAPDPASVKSVGGIMVMGGRASIDIVWDCGEYSYRTPEAIVYGVQWRFLNEPPRTAAEIEASIAHAEAVQAAKKAEESRKAVAFLDACDALRADPEHAHLQQMGTGAGGTGGGVWTAKNIRRDLKKYWPTIKFRVRSDYSSVDVSWIDGPTEKEVEARIGRYKSGYFNGMEDIYEYHEAAWNHVFGGVKYLSADRECSDALVERVIGEVYVKYRGDLLGYARPTVEDFRFNRLWSTPIVSNEISHHWNFQAEVGRQLSEAHP